MFKIKEYSWDNPAVLVLDLPEKGVVKLSSCNPEPTPPFARRFAIEYNVKAF